VSSQCIEQLLLHHGIRPTVNRILVARTLSEAGRPLSQTELERIILSVDKSGVSRALALFRKHHLVHAIEDGTGSICYELCHSHDEDSDDDLHPHFYCERCKRTYCLSDTPLPAIEVAPDFTIHSANYLLKGICPNCQRKH